MNLQERITFASGLKVGATAVRVVSGSRETPAVVSLGKAGSRPRLSVLRGDAVMVFVVKGDVLIQEGETRGAGRVEAFLAAVANPACDIVLAA